MSLLLDSIPAIILIIYFHVYQHENQRAFGAVSLIFVTYIAMSILSIISEIFGYNTNYYPLELFPILYLCFCLILSLWGFFSYRDNHLLTIGIENFLLIRVLENFLLLCSSIAMLFFLPAAITSLSGDIKFNRENLTSLNTLGEFGLINSFFSLVANMFMLNIIFAFINLSPAFSKFPFNKLRSILLLLSSTVYIVYIFAYVGRDGFIYWIMTFFFVFLLLKDFIDNRNLVVLKRFALLIAFFTFFPFAAITYSRFIDNENGILIAVLDYGGMQIHQFNDQFLAFSIPQWGQINFPSIYKYMVQIFDLPISTFNRLEWFSLYTDVGVTPWTFSTFIGAFIFDFGYYFTPLLILLIALLTRRSLRNLSKGNSINFSDLLVFMLCSQIVLYGVFYFRQYSANFYVIAIFILALLFKIFGYGNSVNKIVLSKLISTKSVIAQKNKRTLILPRRGLG